eukprot:1225857-Prymnesium_polylepis.1
MPMLRVFSLEAVARQRRTERCDSRLATAAAILRWPSIIGGGERTAPEPAASVDDNPALSESQSPRGRRVT